MKDVYWIPIALAIALVGVIVLLLVFKRAIGFRIMWALQAKNKGIGNAYLSGNFAPVDKEVHAENLPVEGAIPKELDGWFMKTGPNPHFEPIGGYHWFDGEAMIHSVVLRDGKAKAYSNHWLRTPQFVEEERAGKNMFFRIGDLRGPRGLLIVLVQSLMKLVPKSATHGMLDTGALGNTSLHFHAKKLMALNEASVPFELRMLCSGLLESIGAMFFGGKLKSPFTAHPKVDPASGIMHFIGYNMQKAPFLVYNTVSPKGDLGDAIPIDLRRPTMIHDFGITARYGIVLEHNLTTDPKPMTKDKEASPLRTDVTFPGRIGLLSLKAPSEPVQWFETPPYMALHIANCFEEGDLVHIVVCVFSDIKDADLLAMTPEKPAGFSNQELSRYTVDTKSGTVTRTVLIPKMILDFPVVAPQVVGRPSRFCWCAELQLFKGISVVKADMTAPEGKGLVARIEYPANLRGGEMVFVPRDADALNRGAADEDDGFLIGYLTDESKGESFCVVYDAKTMSSMPLAKITLPQRVPWNFHGAFIPRYLTSQSAISVNVKQ